MGGESNGASAGTHLIVCCHGYSRCPWPLRALAPLLSRSPRECVLELRLWSRARPAHVYWSCACALVLRLFSRAEPVPVLSSVPYVCSLVLNQDLVPALRPCSRPSPALVFSPWALSRLALVLSSPAPGFSCAARSLLGGSAWYVCRFLGWSDNLSNLVATLEKTLGDKAVVVRAFCRACVSLLSFYAQDR